VLLSGVSLRGGRSRLSGPSGFRAGDLTGHGLLGLLLLTQLIERHARRLPVIVTLIADTNEEFAAAGQFGHQFRIVVGCFRPHLALILFGASRAGIVGGATQHRQGENEPYPAACRGNLSFLSLLAARRRSKNERVSYRGSWYQDRTNYISRKSSSNGIAWRSRVRAAIAGCL